MRPLNKLQAVTLAVILFMALHLSLTLASNYLANNSDMFLSLLPWLNIAAYLLYVISGFASSIMIKQQFVPVGLVTGLLSAFTVVVIFGVGGQILGIFATLISGFILGGVGGGLSYYIKRGATNAL